MEAAGEVSDRIAGGKLNMEFDKTTGQFKFVDGGLTDKDLTEYAKCI